MSQHAYKYLSPEEQESLFSNYLISSWSYSKVTQFARHEKVFEMNYIFGIQGKRSSTTVAGEAYHHALKFYFLKRKIDETIDIIEMEQSAFDYIDDVQPNIWKLQKTTPTIDECKIKATKTVTALLRNFIAEVATYESDIKEILDVETYCNEFLTINGVDIPLPCHAKIDLIFRTKDDKVVILDHKSKMSYTGEDEAALSIGVQAITYVKCYEAKMGINVDEVWFIENKFSENRDKSAQLQAFKIALDSDTRSLYEALLYEPLKKMIQATSDPDYTYLINDSDNFVDKAELYDFWARTMISEIEDFNVEESKKALVSKRLKKIRDASINIINPKVIKEFKANASKFIQYDLSNKNMTQDEKIEYVLRSFGTIVKVAHKLEGYSSDTYLLEVSAGVKITSIHSHRLDIANALDVPKVRLSQDLIVYNGKSYLAVEVSKERTSDLMFDAKELSGLRIPIGKDNYQKTIVWDLNNHSTPHILICGATGSGKSVSIRSTVEYAKLAGIHNIVIFDPKYEFMELRGNSAEVYNEIEEIEERMRTLVEDMNELVKTGKKRITLVVFDEFADALAQSKSGKGLEVKEMVQVGNYAPKKGMMGMMEPGAPKMQLQTTGELKSLEENLKILVQKGRACGFRVIAATQRASVKVITGDTKVNFPVQICFRVPKEADSRVVIDESGAEALSGRGDGLMKSPEYTDVVRFQSFYKPETVLC